MFVDKKNNFDEKIIFRGGTFGDEQKNGDDLIWKSSIMSKTAFWATFR